ncbi:MAG: PEP-CTERM sorting domain-containing protein [Nitrospirales bacterium]
MNPSRIGILVFVSLIILTIGRVSAVTIAALDLDGLTLGPQIVGPVGPTVDSSFVNAAGDSLGDLQGSVSCPTGSAACIPPTNPPGTIYTYVHAITPGVDFPNDPPFPQPAIVVPFEDAMEFSLGFPAEGFNGVAGFSSSDTNAALGPGGDFSIELLSDGSLQWMTNETGWGSGETIVFFWQTTQPPSGPGGAYQISNGITLGSGAGPLPTPAPAPIPEPATFGLMLFGFVALLTGRRLITNH